MSNWRSWLVSTGGFYWYHTVLHRVYFCEGVQVALWNHPEKLLLFQHLYRSWDFQFELIYQPLLEILKYRSYHTLSSTHWCLPRVSSLEKTNLSLIFTSKLCDRPTSHSMFASGVPSLIASRSAKARGAYPHPPQYSMWIFILKFCL